MLEPAFAQRLAELADKLCDFRGQAALRLLDEGAFEALPGGQAVAKNFEWRLRQDDVALVLRAISRCFGGAGADGGVRVLDVGAANGWLSHQLALAGHHPLAAECFDDRYDGLGARRFYSTDWPAVQLDLADLSLIDGRFEVVVVNHGLAFFPDPLAHLTALQHKVEPGGLLLVLGLQIFGDSRRRRGDVAALQQRFRDQQGGELFLRPARGYLDRGDRRRFRQAGLVLRPYRRLWLRNLSTLLRRSTPYFCHGFWRAPS